MSLSLLDMVVLGVIALSALLAFMRGFVHEVLAIAAWVGAALISLYSFPTVRLLARDKISIPWAADAAAAVGVFLVALIVLALITGSIAKRVQQSGLNALDRSLGVLFGIARGAVVVSIAFIVLNWVFPRPEDRPSWVTSSKSVPWLEMGANMVRSLIPADLLDNEEALKTNTQTATDKARQAIELQQTLEKLTQTTPSAPTAPQGAPEQSAPTASAPLKSALGTPSPIQTPAPTPTTPSGTSQSATPPTTSAAPAKGYDDRQRQVLDRLFESNQ